MFNVDEILQISTEDTKRSAALRVILKYCNPKDDREVSVRSLCSLAVKYPIMFYSLWHFRTHFRRLVYGDRFWEGRKNVKSQLHLDIKEKEANFNTEKTAIKATAKALIADLSVAEMTDFELSEIVHRTPSIVSKVTFLRMKELFGYQVTKGLLLESEMGVEGDFKLLSATPLPVVEEKAHDGSQHVTERITDKKIKHDFRVDLTSGKNCLSFRACNILCMRCVRIEFLNIT